MSEAEFGHYLVSVEERDVDLLLMEEFHVTDEFSAWFCTRLGLRNAIPVGAWHSVSDADGETDLLLQVVVHGRKIGVMIENKIGAPEQDRQADRYHIRGRRYCEEGKFDDYVTVICAPERYLAGLPAESLYDHRISYESIVEWFANCEGLRAAWRREVMQEAVEQARRGYTMVVSETTTAFHQNYWEYLRAKHPRIHMRRPKNKGRKSNWIILKGRDFPKGVMLHHKIDQQTMELGFERRHIDEILQKKPDWPGDIFPVQKGRTASLAIDVPAIDMRASVDSQCEAMEEVLAAAYRLMPFASLLSGADETVETTSEDAPPPPVEK